MNKKTSNVASLYLKAMELMGVEHVFGMTGGAVSFFLDEFTRNNKVKFIPVNHEQAAAMMAEAYARVRGYSSAIGTSGPGGTNLITGMIGSWMDSIPGLYITGQVSTFDKNDYGSRQRGFQEVPMVEYMKPHTKFSAYINSTQKFGKTLSKAIKTSLVGRPGPVHLDIPINIQKESINPQKLNLNTKRSPKKLDVSKLLELLKLSKRPVFIVGHGVLMGNATNKMIELLDLLNMPVVPTWGYINFQQKNVVGTIGVYGNRGCNMCIQNSDLIIAVGTRLDTRVTGGNTKSFAPDAKKIIVDIDRGELNKLRHDLSNKVICFQTDALSFVNSVLIHKKKLNYNFGAWYKKVNSITKKFPIAQPQNPKAKHITPHGLVLSVSDHANNNDIIIPDSGGNLSWTLQAWQYKTGQKLFSSLGNSPMGYALPASIGASFAANNGRVICMAGDGGLLVNIQELETLSRYNLPVKIFVFNNQGYGIIRNFNSLYLGSRHLGSEFNQYDFAKIANGFGIQSATVSKPNELNEAVKKALSTSGAYLLDVKLDPESIIEPRTIFGKTIGEQSPFLPEKEFNQITKLIKE